MRPLWRVATRGGAAMSKNEMINEIQSLCNANKDNMYCSIYWLANQIKEIVEGNSYLGDLEEQENDN